MTPIIVKKSSEGMPPRVASTVLFQGGNFLMIQHNGDEYRLQLTQNNKLILTK
jgi:hemin uptake protein HemP